MFQDGLLELECAPQLGQVHHVITAYRTSNLQKSPSNFQQLLCDTTDVPLAQNCVH
jgi:hypothetical protein